MRSRGTIYRGQLLSKIEMPGGLTKKGGRGDVEALI